MHVASDIHMLDWKAFDIIIACKDAGGNVLGSATVNSVVINANQKTTLSGNLFTGSGNNSSPQRFVAVADTAWGSAGPQIGFSLRRH